MFLTSKNGKDNSGDLMESNLCESVVAYVKNEQELIGTIASEADGLIVVDGKIELYPEMPLELFEGQSLVGLKHVGKDGESELVFHPQKGLKILKLADSSKLADLKITVDFGKFNPMECLLEVNSKKEIRFENLEIELRNRSDGMLEQISLARLNNALDVECEGKLELKAEGSRIKGFEVLNNSKLNLRCDLIWKGVGDNNFAVKAENGATVNLFSGARIDVAHGGNECSPAVGGICNQDSTVNIFGGARLKFSGSKILVNEVETQAGFFVYKNAEISRVSVDDEKVDTWKCRRFWRERSEKEISGFDDLEEDFYLKKLS